ncbi:Ig-like domain-containing protein [Agromyces subbeticus]|uniref:Ig-like domain-containing protein n=1 Tax=Agromyces subbeticus TaxID=293890 RepID=UPI0003B476C9|nr:Ig-like domain-containing protein [Agromyces subbeticus]
MSDHPGFSNLVTTPDFAARVSEALGHLPADAVGLLRLAIVERLSVPEIAARTELGEVSIEASLSRARAELLELLRHDTPDDLSALTPTRARVLAALPAAFAMVDTAPARADDGQNAAPQATKPPRRQKPALCRSRLVVPAAAPRPRRGRSKVAALAAPPSPRRQSLVAAGTSAAMLALIVTAGFAHEAGLLSTDGHPVEIGAAQAPGARPDPDAQAHAVPDTNLSDPHIDGQRSASSAPDDVESPSAPRPASSAKPPVPLPHQSPPKAPAKAPAQRATPSSEGAERPAPAITAVDTAEGLVSPRVSGTASPGARVSATTTAGRVSANADETGLWTMLLEGLDAGDTRVSIVQTDANGTTSGAVSTVVELVVPVVTVDRSGEGDATVTVSGRPGTDVELVVNGSVAATIDLPESGASVTRSLDVADPGTVGVRYRADDRVGATVSSVE